jgi:hypothetical protein
MRNLQIARICSHGEGTAKGQRGGARARTRGRRWTRAARGKDRAAQCGWPGAGRCACAAHDDAAQRRCSPLKGSISAAADPRCESEAKAHPPHDAGGTRKESV